MKITANYRIIYREPASLDYGSFYLRLNRIPAVCDIRLVMKECERRGVTFIGMILGGFENEVIELLTDKK